MPNIINTLIARELQESFEGAEGMVFVNASGLTVAENEDLRGKLEEKGVSMRMVRNRIARLVLSERGFEPPEDLFRGNVACVVGSVEDAVNAAKVFTDSDLYKKHKKVAFRGGMLEGNLLDAEAARALSELPSKDELRAMMLGALSGPARGLAGVLHAPLSALARGLQAHADADAAEGDDA